MIWTYFPKLFCEDATTVDIQYFVDYDLVHRGPRIKNSMAVCSHPSKKPIRQRKGGNETRDVWNKNDVSLRVASLEIKRNMKNIPPLPPFLSFHIFCFFFFFDLFFPYIISMMTYCSCWLNLIDGARQIKYAVRESYTPTPSREGGGGGGYSV